MPAPFLYSGINRFAAPPAGSMPELGDTYTDETVEGIVPGGLYVIRGIATPTRGGLQAQVGSRVTVLWRRGIPFMVINAQTRKGTGDDVPGDLFPVAEQLLSHPDTSEIWFRNYHTFAPILFVDSAGAIDPTINPQILNVQIPQWGRGDSDHFLVFSVGDTTRVAVYRLLRPTKNTPFKKVPLVKAVLVRFYNLNTDPIEFGTITITSTSVDLTDSGTATGPLKYNAQYVNPGTSVPPGTGPFGIRIDSHWRHLSVAPNGDLMVTIYVSAQSGAGEVGEAGLIFGLGSILVNAATGTVVANHLAASMSASAWASQTVLPAPPTCQQTGSVVVGASLGGATASAGDIVPLSITGSNPATPATSPGTFNNYLLLSPAWSASGGTNIILDGVVVGTLFCGAARVPLSFSVIGEYSELNTEFATFASDPNLNFVETPSILFGPSGSRGVLGWQTIKPGVGVINGKIRDLRRGVTTDLEGTEATFLASSLLLLQSMLMYQPIDPVSPHNKQFFVGGHNRASGVFNLNVDTPKKLASLKRVAPLAKTRNAVQVAIVTGGSYSVQILVFRPSLRHLYVGGPL